MSVYRKDYIVYGWKLPYDIDIDFWDDKFKSMREGHPGEEFCLIMDGMCGDYIVFGFLVKIDNNEWEGWDFFHLDFANLNAEKVKNKYKEVFNVQDISEPYLFIFSHFS